MITVRNTQVQQMAQAAPGQQMVLPCKDTKTWVEVRLVDEGDNPVPNERYKIRLPDQSLMEGSLDADGMVRFESITPGTCLINFPDIDGREWEPV